MTTAPPVPRIVTLDVRGVPVPQGSVSQWRMPNGKTATKYPPGVYRWRAQVQEAAMRLGVETFTGAVEVHLGFDLQRAQAHFGTGRNLNIIKASAPPYPINRKSGDIDKLTRCILDALTDAAIWNDDSQVVTVIASKRYADRPGVLIKVAEIVDYQP